MKRILLFILIVSGLLSSALVRAQSFTVQADTVSTTVTVPGPVALSDSIIPTGGSVTINWKVVSCNFPSDWLAESVFGLCDGNVCYQNSSNQLWNGTTGNTFSCTYTSGSGSHNYDLQLDLTHTTSTGSYYVTVRFDAPSISTITSETFIINRGALGVTNINSGVNDIVLYPNPARDELNVVYNANADVKNIAVYNIIGKVMMVYKVLGDSANLNLENIPSGIYFVRLTNSHGDVVTTRKFTKQ